jgi:CO/xanthine dehydrogenase FAD-binding subunit
MDVHPSDPATALALLRAKVEVRGPAGGAARELAIGELLGPPTRERPRFHALAPGEVIAAIHIPAPPEGFQAECLRISGGG